MEQQILDRFPGIGCAYRDCAGHEGAASYGFADREHQIPVDGNTIFPACSISKFITAICVMKLHERCMTDIDVPVNRYLQQWKLRTPQGHESDATARALLCHTAGIADGDDAFYGLRRDGPDISLMDILEGRTTYNNRPARAENPQGTAFAYSDAGYCVLQLLVEETSGKPFPDVAKELIFDTLHLENTFFASCKNIDWFETNCVMATGYDGDGLPLPGRFPPCPDLAASGLWSTPAELLAIAKAFLEALKGCGSFLQQTSAQMIATPAEQFPWTGMGVFMGGEGMLISQGWGENGQCMMKMNPRTDEISVVMTNRNPEVDQAASGVEWLVDSKLNNSK